MRLVPDDSAMPSDWLQELERVRVKLEPLGVLHRDYALAVQGIEAAQHWLARRLEQVA